MSAHGNSIGEMSGWLMPAPNVGVGVLFPLTDRSGNPCRTATMFRGIVPKMHKSLTLLATFQAKLVTHENSGGHISSGAAHHGWSGLYRSAFHHRSGDCSTGELSGL